MRGGLFRKTSGVKYDRTDHLLLLASTRGRPHELVRHQCGSNLNGEKGYTVIMHHSAPSVGAIVHMRNRLTSEQTQTERHQLTNVREA